MQTESDFIVAFLQFKILRGEAGDEFVCRATGKNRVYPQPDGGSDGCPDKIPQYLWNRRVSTRIQAVRGKGYYGGSGKIRKSDPSLQPGAALPAAFTGCGRRLFDLPLGDEDIL